MSKVKNASSLEIDFDAAVNLMDDGLREAIHDELAPCPAQEFFSAYENTHEKKYGEPWELSKANPTW